MKIAIRRGHQRTGSDGCAVGILNEIDVANAYYSLVITKLKALGHQVLDVTPPEANRSLHDSLWYGINKANNWGADLFVSCHANKAYNNYNGSIGCEVIYHKNSTKGKKYATRIEKELTNIGFKSRGAKIDVRGLAETNNTDMPCVIIEPFFLEATGDVANYNRVGAEGIANAIVKGITNKCVVEKTNKEEKIVDTIISYFGDADVFSAIILSQKLHCSVIKESDLDTVKAKKIIRVGGSNSSVKKGNRFDTFKGVSNLL